VPVQAFPTWVIGGAVVEGELDLDSIERLLAAASAEDGVGASSARQ
jgi:hypothetical protein